MMRVMLCLRRFKLLVSVMFGVAAVAVPVSAQTSGSISFGANLGALNYTVTTTARSCVSAYWSSKLHRLYLQ
jgi:hypothetical protein